MIAADVMAWLAFATSWLRGGHTERFATTVLVCDYAFTRLVSRTAFGENGAAAATFVVTLIVIWMALSSNRWWPLVAAASLTLCVMIHVMEWVNPDLSQYAAESAQLGLWMVVYLAVGAGAGERWLAGEGAISDRRAWTSKHAL